MSLKSKLFKGDKKLEACQISHAAHITEGAAGDHVAKIQTALFLVDGQIIDPGELSAKRYGPSTANAVLTYKSSPKRHIVGSYQQSPDNIVGIQTITFLDKEMLAFEGTAGSTSSPSTAPAAHPPAGAPGRGMCGSLREVASGFLRGSPIHVIIKGGMDAVFEFENTVPYDTRVEITLGTGSPSVVVVAATYGPFISRANKAYLKLEATPVSWDFVVDASATYIITPPAIPPIIIPDPFSGKPVTTPPITPPPISVPRLVAIRWRLKTDWQPGEPACTPYYP